MIVSRTAGRQVLINADLLADFPRMEIGPIGFGPATFRLRTGGFNRLSHAQRLLCLSSSHLRRFVPNQREVSRTASEIQRLANSVSEAPPEGAEATALRRTVSVGDAINQKASDSSAVVRSSRLSGDGCEHKISIRPRADADAPAPSSNSITGVMAAGRILGPDGASSRAISRLFSADIQSACSSSSSRSLGSGVAFDRNRAASQTEHHGFANDLSGRGEWIRTTDPSVPNRVLYQTEPRPDTGEFCGLDPGGRAPPMRESLF